MYLKNIYLYIYLYFFSFKNVSNQPTCFFRHDKQNPEKNFFTQFHTWKKENSSDLWKMKDS